MIRYARSVATCVIRRHSDGACIPADPANRDYAEFLAAVAADPSCVADEPSPPLTEAACIAAIQQRMDAHAQSWGYDDIKSAASYDGDEDPTFNAEATALKRWRSRTWRTGYRILAQAQAGQRTITTIPELLALLPTAPDRPAAP